ncbi:MAG: hypothetical protein V3S51_06995 [Dehalococcoidia bacterium]
MMNIDINLLPEELRPKPLIATRTLVLVVLVALLGYGCYYFYGLKSNSQAEAASLESRIQATQTEAMSLSNDLDVRELVAAISEVEAEKAALETLVQDYEVFADSKIMWGDIVQRVSSRAPAGVTVDSILQGSDNTVEVGGVATGYDRAAVYATALESDEAFNDVPTREWDGLTGRFLLTVNIVVGGGR